MAPHMAESHMSIVIIFLIGYGSPHIPKASRRSKKIRGLQTAIHFGMTATSKSCGWPLPTRREIELSRPEENKSKLLNTITLSCHQPQNRKAAPIPVTRSLPVFTVAIVIIAWVHPHAAEHSPCQYLRREAHLGANVAPYPSQAATIRTHILARSTIAMNLL